MLWIVCLTDWEDPAVSSVICVVLPVECLTSEVAYFLLYSVQDECSVFWSYWCLIRILSFILQTRFSNAVFSFSFLLWLFFQKVCRALSFHLSAGVFPWLQAGGVKLLYLALSFQHVVNPFVTDGVFTEELPAGAVSADNEVQVLTLCWALDL